MNHREKLTAAMVPQAKSEAVEYLETDAAYLRREAERIRLAGDAAFAARVLANAESSEEWAEQIKAAQ
jgi:hypothetical protein